MVVRHGAVRVAGVHEVHEGDRRRLLRQEVDLSPFFFARLAARGLLLREKIIDNVYSSRFVRAILGKIERLQK